MKTNKPLSGRAAMSEENSRPEWQTTFDAVNAAIWVLDGEQRIRQSNRTAERLFGRLCQEMVGRHCWEIVHQTGEPKPECPILRAKESLGRESIELPIGDRWFEVTVDPILDKEGRYAGAVHIVSDISERKKADAKLAEHRHLLTALNEYATVLQLIPPEQLKTFVIDSLKEITHAAAVFISDYDVETSELVVVGSTLAPDSDSTLRRMLGRSVMGLRSPVSSEMYQEILTSSVGIRRSLHEASFGAVPKPVGAAVEKVLGLTGLTGLALRKDQKLVGTLMIVADKATRQIDPGLLNSFAVITAISIERKRADAALQHHVEDLRVRNDALTRFNAAMVDRELQMIELKREVNELCLKLGGSPRYKVVAVSHASDAPPEDQE